MSSVNIENDMLTLCETTLELRNETGGSIMAPTRFLSFKASKAQKRVPGRNCELFIAIETKISPQRSVFMLFQAIKKTNLICDVLNFFCSGHNLAVTTNNNLTF